MSHRVCRLLALLSFLICFCALGSSQVRTGVIVDASSPTRWKRIVLCTKAIFCSTTCGELLRIHRGKPEWLLMLPACGRKWAAFFKFPTLSILRQAA